VEYQWLQYLEEEATAAADQDCVCGSALVADGDAGGSMSCVESVVATASITESNIAESSIADSSTAKSSIAGSSAAKPSIAEPSTAAEASAAVAAPPPSGVEEPPPSGVGEQLERLSSSCGTATAAAAATAATATIATDTTATAAAAATEGANTAAATEGATAAAAAASAAAAAAAKQPAKEPHIPCLKPEITPYLLNTLFGEHQLAVMKLLEGPPSLTKDVLVVEFLIAGSRAALVFAETTGTLVPVFNRCADSIPMGAVVTMHDNSMWRVKSGILFCSDLSAGVCALHCACILYQSYPTSYPTTPYHPPTIPCVGLEGSLIIYAPAFGLRMVPGYKVKSWQSWAAFSAVKSNRPVANELTRVAQGSGSSASKLFQEVINCKTLPLLFTAASASGSAASSSTATATATAPAVTAASASGSAAFSSTPTTTAPVADTSWADGLDIDWAGLGDLFGEEGAEEAEEEAEEEEAEEAEEEEDFGLSSSLIVNKGNYSENNLFGWLVGSSRFVQICLVGWFGWLVWLVGWFGGWFGWFGGCRPSLE
jgi:hypothetical protein